MDDLLVPLAEDCARLRETLLSLGLPPVWQLDGLEARMLYRERSLAARALWQPPLDAIPVTADDLDLPLDLPAVRRYVPEAGAPADGTCLVWLHGGGWVLGDLETADPVARTACAATGWTVLSVDYRCAPVSRFPAAVEDAVAATAWALDRYPRVVVGGDSAGGNLAAAVAQRLGGRPGLVGQVLVYPATDMSLSRASAHAFLDGPFLTRADMEWFVEQYVPSPEDRRHPDVDVATGLRVRDAAPVAAVVLTVGHDPLRDEGIAYAAAMAERGAAVTWIHAPELFHGAFSSSGFLPSAAARADEVWAAARALFA